MSLLERYKGIFDQVRLVLEGIPELKRVLVGEAFRLGELPMAIVTPRETLIERVEMGKTLIYTVNWDTFILIRETEPTDWFNEVILILCEVHDAIMADDTLGGRAVEVTPILLSPGEITAQNRLYYGGLIRFQADLPNP